MDSILTSIKKLLGIAEEYNQFDADLILHINSVFFILSQMGVGPKEGFSIIDSVDMWDDYMPFNSNLELVKSYMHLKVKLLFDPPLGSAVVGAMNNLINEFEYRLFIATDPKQLTVKGEIQNE